MNHCLWFAGLTLTVLSPVIRLFAAEGQSDMPHLRILVPAYFYPAGEGLDTWAKLIESHDPGHGIDIVAIANINSGNLGTEIDPNYAHVLKRASKKGVTLIGYITSDYANRAGNAPLDVATRNIRRWFEQYPEIQGIFVDEQTSDAASIDGYYKPLREQIDKCRPGALVIGNPGTVCVTDYVAEQPTGRIIDAVVIHENNETKLPYEATKPADWMANYAPERFAVLVHTSSTFESQIETAAARGVGYVYVTDAVGPPPDTIHPWGKLPTFWKAELKLISDLNRPRQQ